MPRRLGSMFPIGQVGRLREFGWVSAFWAGTEAQVSLGTLSAYLLSGYGAYITGSVMGIDEV